MVTFAILTIRFSDTQNLFVLDMRLLDDFALFLVPSEDVFQVPLVRVVGEVCYVHLERLLLVGTMNTDGR